ncbi:hypothetical protein FA15DRAFT_675955 [Coprinopsis marcescibilis]|uniref:Uncharacterized protein n=1 Tax=Coprinopsis marcescibilis TaxID=230819 RepID=A0A5C3KCX9_COPMA|nr:hypothetical protein FA15DRAFT_675955 [Coprinopsis marcescibilis]
MRLIPPTGDLSDMRTVLLRYSDPKDPSPIPSPSPSSSPSSRIPSRFPTDTRGFFYLHAAQDTHGRLLPSTQLRFRLLPTADPAHFASGTDLTQPCGARWAQPLDKLLRYPMYQPLLRLMVQDGFLEQRVYERVCRAVLKRTGGRNALGSEFFFEFGMSKKVLGYADGGKEEAVELRFRPHALALNLPGYSGTGIARVERAEAFGTTLVLRVVEALTPPNPDDLYVQKEGQLLKWCYPTGVETVWQKTPRVPLPAHVLERLPVAEDRELF